MSEEDAMDHPQPTKSFSRRGGQVMIGRASRSSGELPTVENGWYRNAVMSRRHAILRWGQAGISIQDKDSTHGTRVYRAGQILTAREQPVLLRDNDEVQFGKTVHRVDGKSDASIACHNPLRVRVSITQPSSSDLPNIQVKPEPVSPEKPGKFMSHTFSLSAGGDSEDEERNVLKKVLEMDDSAETVTAPNSKSTASTAEKSDMSISENDDEDDEANQFTFSSPPLPDSTAGKPVPSQYIKRSVATLIEKEEEEEDNESAKGDDEDEEVEDMEESEPEDDPFTSSRPNSPDATMKTVEIDGDVALEEGESQNNSSATQETSEEKEDDPSQSSNSQTAAAEVRETALVNKSGSNAKEAAEKEINGAVDGKKSDTKDSDKSIASSMNVEATSADISKSACIPIVLPRTSSQTSSGRTIHFFEPQFLPEVSPTSALSSSPVVAPDSQEPSVAGLLPSGSSKTTQTTLYGFFKPTNTVSTSTTNNNATTPPKSDEESPSDTSEGTISPSPVQHKIETSMAPVQVIGKRKRDDEVVDSPVGLVSQPVKPIKKARRGFSFKTAVSHTVSLAAGAVMAVALLSVMPELDA